ncbi:MAG: glycosyltransferase family 39 protein [Vicinamibacteria bacterium]|nr:glycosyltransferase family 39 protein [Vicinamibacteria bacterium]
MILALTAILSEGLARTLRRHLTLRGRSYLKMYLWALRPWLAWSLVSVIFRSWPHHAFNEPETFPFYADPWDPDTAVRDRIMSLVLRPAFWACALPALVILAAMCLKGVHLLRRTLSTGGVSGWGILSLCVLSLAFSLTVNFLPSGWSLSQPRAEGSFLRPWHNPSATLWPAVRRITSARDHLSRFLEYQHKLGVHGHSHPPGASLSLYWIGRLATWGGSPTPWHYALGLAVVSSVNGLFVFWLGRRLFSTEIGVCAVMLWGLSPATTIYSVFAQESLYAVFFNAALLCMWMIAASRRSRGWGLALGLILACLAMLNYSWSVAATMFVVFSAWDGRIRGRSMAEIARRVAWPLIVFVVLLGSVLLAFRLDYLAMYRGAYDHVMHFYSLRGWYQHAAALFGGQLAVFLMMGSLCGSAFIVSALRADGERRRRHAMAFLGSVLAVYCVPLLMVPAVRVEAPRQWNWIATLPIVFAASLLWEKERGRPAWILAACCVSGLTAIIMRVFLVFWG